MRSSQVPLLHLAAIVLFALSSAISRAASAPVLSPAANSTSGSGQPATLVITQLGKGTAPLDGKWQFHLGDDPSWANPNIDDSNWEQITADAPWGTQGHASYTGYAWYRRHISISSADGVPANIALLIPAIDEVYEIYWNGTPVAHMGSFPPHLDVQALVPPQTYGLGPIRSGVLAVKVFKLPLSSNEDGTAGGFEKTPIIGSPQAIANLKGAGDFRWLQRRQFRFGLVSLYVLTSILSLLVWLRDRRQWLLFWMAVFTFMPLSELFLTSLGLQASYLWLTCLTQITIQVREIAQWYLLIWLLQLHEHPRLLRIVRVFAIVSLTAGTLDGALSFVMGNTISDSLFQVIDALLTGLILPGEAIPIVLVVYALAHRKRLDSARWLVAGLAVIGGTIYAITNIGGQGVRFTHWTFPQKMDSSLFTLFGSTFALLGLVRLLLFFAIVYAVIRYAISYRHRQTALEQEYQNARELQQILVPEALPDIPGFTLTSAYKPAQEVGGDFFQIIPLDDGSTVIVLGDVSGKGLKAAMTVSLIVGAIRTLAKFAPNPAEMLAELNQRLHGRMQDGFATCIALRISSEGRCVLSSAGHPSPFLNQRELALPGALPLGLVPGVAYEEIALQLSEGDHFSIYTDGLLEARNSSGELYGFERLNILFGSHPSATQASEEAVAFGQDDDITVITLHRVPAGIAAAIA